MHIVPESPLPEYVCHKHVWALKIKAISTDEAVGALLTPCEVGFADIRVSDAYMRKHAPVVGGYWVRYRDGYESFSPAKEFEDGYTRWPIPSGTGGCTQKAP